MGYTFAGTTIQIYDDNDATGGHAVGQPHTAAEMAASTDPNVAANWVLLAGNIPKYRSLMNVRVASSTGGQTNTTTWTDQDAIFDFDNTRTISFGVAAGGNSPNATLNWGVKVGSGNRAGARNGVTVYLGNTTLIRGNPNLYACNLVQAPVGGGLFQIVPTTGGGDIIGCTLGHRGTGGTAQIVFGSSAQAVNNVFNLNAWSNVATASAGIFSTFNCTNAEEVHTGGNSYSSAIRSAQSTLSAKDLTIHGTPLVADIVCNASVPITWTFVRPHWSGNAPKFNPMNAGVTVGSVTEYWLLDTKIVNSAGSGVSGISVVLTDVLGNTLINTTTDANGRISFGSGLTLNAVPVMDHYGDGVNYLTRARSPFLAQVNVTNTNLAYNKIAFPFTWPTDANGNFEDVAVIVPISPPTGSPTTWQEYELGAWPPA